MPSARTSSDASLMRIHVIVNTAAHLYRTKPWLIDQIRHVSGTVAEVHATAHLLDLEQRCTSLSVQGADLIVLSGGDGSHMAGLTAIARAFGEDRIPRLVMLPGGTAATVAHNWGTAGDPVVLLERILHSRTRLRAVRRPTLRVKEFAAEQAILTPGEHRARSERLGFMFGTGLVAKFFSVYYAEGGRGYAGAAKIVARIFAESFVGGQYARNVLDPLPCTLSVDGRRLAPDAWSLICAAVVRDLGIHMLVTYRAAEDPERPHLVASPLPSRKLGPRAPRVLLGKPIGGEGHFDDLVRELSVQFAAEGPYVLDGDMFHAGKVVVSAGPCVDVVTLE
jgi:diacylglycerol kinase (ATP)